jgi:endonuclease/exonuclease/phosphatase family metal-dependent hydrolase
MRSSDPALVLGFLLLLGAAAQAGPSAAATELTLASWNLEWLVSDRSRGEARTSCARGRRARLPCDVAVAGARDSADIAALAAVARRLDADVIGFQEVEDEATASRVFRGFRLCMAGSTGLQDVGFAIRPGLPFRCGPHLTGLALAGRSRSGAGLTLFPGTRREIRLLGVHLKSGCPTADLEGATTACRMLAEQADILAGWIRERVAEGDRYAVIGDFNRDLRADARRQAGVWQRLATTGSEPDAASLEQAFRNCVPGQPYSAYIDHILAGGSLARLAIPGSFWRMTYEPAAVRHHRLSDHCPIRLSFRLSP